MLGQIFTKNHNNVQALAMLAKIIDMINCEQWSLLKIRRQHWKVSEE